MPPGNKQDINKSGKLTIFGTGGPAILFILLGLFCIYALVMTIIDAIHNGSILEFLGAIVLYGWFLVYPYKYVVGNRIRLYDNELLITYNKIPKTVSYARIFPSVISEEINISDIKVVVLATQSYLAKHKEILAQDVDTFDYMPDALVTGEVVIPARYTAIKWQPVLYVLLRDSKRNLIEISTKPFSRRGLRKLVKLLKNKGVNVVIQDGLI